jgi:transcriptional regulator
MYLPPYFNERKINVLHECIAQHPFGMLVTQGKNGLDVNHLPFELTLINDQPGVLSAHIARANPLWQEVQENDEVLAVFKAADAYISPNWYPSKHESHQQVPTWNYITVHAYGSIQFHQDEKWLRGLLARLTRTHEATQTVPWKISDAPKEYIDELIQRIVGLEIHITRLVGKSKLNYLQQSWRFIAGAPQRRWVTRDPPKDGYSPNFI